MKSFGVKERLGGQTVPLVCSGKNKRNVTHNSGETEQVK